MDVNPQDYQSPLLVAQSYSDLGDEEKAKESRLRGIKIAEARLMLNPDDSRALYMGANGLVALGRYKQGLEWAKQALAIDRQNDRARQIRTQVRDKLVEAVEQATSRGELESALRRLEAGDDPEQRRLAGAGRPQQRDQLAVGHLEPDVVERGVSPEPFRQPLDPDAHPYRPFHSTTCFATSVTSAMTARSDATAKAAV